MRAGTSGLVCGDVYLGTGAHVSCHGKRRSAASTPLHQSNVDMLSAWLAEDQGEPGQPLFPSRCAERHPPSALPGIAVAPISLFCTREAISVTGVGTTPDNQGYRASSRLTAIAERDDHGVWRAGVGRGIDRGTGGGFAAFSGSVRRCEIGWSCARPGRSGHREAAGRAGGFLPRPP